MTKFIIVDNHEIVSKHKVTYKEVGSDTEQTLEYIEPQRFYYQRTKLPDGYIMVSKLSDKWREDCLHELGEDELDEYFYDDYDGTSYWCVQIGGEIYESNFSCSNDRPEWATHYTYYSK